MFSVPLRLWYWCKIILGREHDHATLQVISADVTSQKRKLSEICQPSRLLCSFRKCVAVLWEEAERNLMHQELWQCPWGSHACNSVQLDKLKCTPVSLVLGDLVWFLIYAECFGAQDLCDLPTCSILRLWNSLSSRVKETTLSFEWISRCI